MADSALTLTLTPHTVAVAVAGPTRLMRRFSFVAD